MNTMNFDWRWIGLIFLLLFILSPSRQTGVVILAIGAAWLIQAGIEPWRSGRSTLGGSKVTYWRGQRIVTKQPVRTRIRSISSVQTLVSIVYLILGAGCAYAAIFLFLALTNLI